MDDPRATRLPAEASAGRLSRRQALEIGLRLGLATPVIAALMAAAPERTAAAPPRVPGTLPRPQGTSTGTFTLMVDGSTPDLDPHSGYDNQASMINLGVYEMLVRYKGESTEEIEPMLAESWETSADGSVVTFKLFPNVAFHDGTPCDAEAVRASFERFLLMDMGPVNVIKRFVRDPAQIVAVDPVTVRFDLGQPQPLFLPAMASSYGPMVVNTALVAAHKTDEDPWANEWFRKNASGTGPYRLTENDETSQVVLAKFDEYHKGWEQPHFDQIVIRVVEEVGTRRQLLESGDADATLLNLTPDIIDELRANPDLQIVTYDSTAVFWVTMNVPRLKTVEARRGFSYAFPYDDVMNSAYRGLIIRSGPLANNVRGHDPNVFLYQTDLAQAKDLILAGGHAEGDTFEYLFASGDEVERTIAQLFQANVQEIGFNLELVEVERGTLLDLTYGDTPAEERPHFFGGQGWWPDYNDPWNQFSPNFTDKAKDGTANAGFYLNPRFEELMAEAETYTDEARLVELMAEAQNILTEQDPPAIYYGQLLWYAVLRQDIQGFVPNPLYLNAFPFGQMSRQVVG